MRGLREPTRQRTSLQLSTSSVIEPREAERVTGARGPIAVANRLLTPDGVAIWAFGLRALVGLAMILRKME